MSDYCTCKEPRWEMSGEATYQIGPSGTPIGTGMMSSWKCSDCGKPRDPEDLRKAREELEKEFGSDQGPPGFPDKVAYLEDGWCVRFRGEIQASRWNDRGPALAALELLQRGLMKPDPEPLGKTAQDFRFEIDLKYVNDDQHQIDSHPCAVCGERYIDHDGREAHRYVPAPTAR